MPPARRGRPTSLGDEAADPWPRVERGQLAAWLLKMWRLYGHDDILTIRQMAAAVRTPPVDNATVSRWENSRATVPVSALRRYERLFGLPPGELVAVVTALGRDRPVGRRTAPPGAELLGKCLDRAPVSAAEWADLTVSLTQPRRRLARPVWDTLVHRLLTEMCLSVGWRYLLRLSALQRVHRHPEGGAALVAATEEFVTEPACQLIIDQIALLAANPTPAASRRLFRLLCEPRNDAEQLGALFAWAARPPRAPDMVRRLEAVVRELRAGASTAPPVREAASDVVAALFRHRPSRPGARSAPLGKAGEAAFGALHGALTRAQIRHHDDDVLGPRILRQALASTDSDLRILTVNVLHASPFRGILADTVASLLSSGRTRTGSPIHRVLVDLQGSLGEARHRPVVENLVRRDTARDAAAVALAHLPGRTDLRLWHHVLTAQPTGARTQRAVLYAVGMKGDRDGLRLLRAHAPLVRARANWWLRLPAEASAGAAL
ncbi:helix-turn-helix transcriptional regulator [Amycolatopsis sp. NPDC049688]|uniref:helix-turn-helix domain-containing protein n=1 Tax=Amycolatopsis sp. NPDC049688 TaxID=3154733 RepID=UPI00342E6A05